MLTIKEFTNNITHRLQPLYDEREAAAIASLYVCSRFGWERYELVLHGDEPLPESLMVDLQQDVLRLEQGCPVQYVLDEAEFYGLTFQVDPSVLIPRPETEELVQMIVNQYVGRNISLWDVGTGSGCIAVTLAKLLPDAEVFATDISEEALAVARRNAEMNGVEVTFACHDMADVEHLPFGETRFDVLVSNPPYIPTSDRALMHRNVTDFEPGLALFVPDDDKLRCYRALGCLAKATLKTEGCLYMETYHDFHEELTALFRQHGFEDVQSIRDLNEKLRFVTAKKR